MFATQNWADDRYQGNEEANGGHTMVRPEIDNESEIEELSDRDASLRRTLVRLQLENQRLKTLVVTLTKTVLDNVVRNATYKDKRN
jgi:hypothetical protein